MKLDHISPSTLGQAARCGEQLRHRLQEGPEPPGFSLIRGRAVHKSIESNLTAKMTHGATLSLAELDAITRDEITRALEVDDVRLDLAEDGESLTWTESRDVTIDSAITLSTLHARVVAPVLLPTAVEVRVELVTQTLPVPLVGVIDLIALDRGNGEAVRDHKTAAKKPDARAAVDSDQLTAYDALYRGLRGEPPKRLILDQLVMPTKTLPARYFEQESAPRGDADFAALAGRVDRVVAMVDKEIWIPAPEGSWACSERFCGYWSRCVFARGRNRPTQ